MQRNATSLSWPQSAQRKRRKPCARTAAFEEGVELVLDELRQAGARSGGLGVIATNTTLARHAVNHLPGGQETGELSGAPLLAASNRVIRLLRAALGPAYPIIGVGGVMSGTHAKSTIAAGADLVQIYTG